MMKLVKPSYEIIPQKAGLEGIYEQIELAGRNCYKSERKEGTTAKDFVDRMIASKHLSVLEHGTVYLKTPAQYNYDDLIRFYSRNPYSKVFEHKEDYKSKEWENAGFYITTNLRVLVENNRLEDLKLLCEPTEYHEKRVTVKFVSMIQFYKDLTRHRKMSFCVESTRYCNYSQERFGNELTFIIPSWIDLPEGRAYWDEYELKFETNDHKIINIELATHKDVCWFLTTLIGTAEAYIHLINKYKWKPQQAAKVLPQDTKADIICTGFISDWEHIFSMRSSIASTGQPDTEVKLLIDPLMNEFKEKKFI